GGVAPGVEQDLPAGRTGCDLDPGRGGRRIEISVVPVLGHRVLHQTISLSSGRYSLDVVIRSGTGRIVIQ
ncbi:MAG: hypothetical protein K9L68_13980, partial [Spirochaetales bacterium]|nr:hypothetical protein [Spirochaetales bacterium]